MGIEPSIQLQYSSFSDYNSVTLGDQDFDFSPCKGPIAIHHDEEGTSECSGDVEQVESQECGSVKMFKTMNISSSAK